MTSKETDEPLDAAEVAEVKRYARGYQRLWVKRSIYSVVLLFLSCALVVPFSKGHSLHAHAEPFGRLLVVLSLGLLVLVLYCAFMAVMSWVSLREVLREPDFVQPKPNPEKK
jgi:Mn2+/Fe2+ NRAMP family transporter